LGVGAAVYVGVDVGVDVGAAAGLGSANEDGGVLQGGMLILGTVHLGVAAARIA
jgi:hypothetical protein